jgi:hypothetical protein
MSSDDVAPSYEKLLKAALDLDAAEELALFHRPYSSIDERRLFYKNKDAALQAVKDACAAGEAAEAGRTEAVSELDSLWTHPY